MRRSSAVISATILLIAASMARTAGEGRPIVEQSFDSVLGGIPCFYGIANGSPIYFLLDTGGAGSLIDRAAAERLRMKIAEGAQASVANAERATVGVILESTVGVGEATVDTRLVVPQLKPLQPIFGRPVEAILGGDFLQKNVVELDYKRQVLKIYKPEFFSPFQRAVSVPLTMVNGIPFVELQVALPNGKSIRGMFLVDSGGVMDIHIHKSIADREHLVTDLPGRGETGVGIGGASSRFAYRGQEAIIGSFHLKKPIVVVTQDTAGQRANPNSIGLVGMGLLAKFHLAFDYSRSQLWLKPENGYEDANVYDATGLLLRSDPPSFSSVHISLIREGTPAQDAGLRVGDVIVRVDHRDATKSGVNELRRVLNRPNRTILLEVRRTGEFLRFKMKTRELLP